MGELIEADHILFQVTPGVNLDMLRAHASAVLEGSASTLDELRAGSGDAVAQAAQALGAGCPAVLAAPGAVQAVRPLIDAGAPVAALDGTVAAETLTAVRGIAAVAAAGASDWTRDLRLALARRDGPIVSLETQTIAPERYVVERHLCIDTTAAGGNASLLATVE